MKLCSLLKTGYLGVKTLLKYVDVGVEIAENMSLEGLKLCSLRKTGYLGLKTVLKYVDVEVEIV